MSIRSPALPPSRGGPVRRRPAAAYGALALAFCGLVLAVPRLATEAVLFWQDTLAPQQKSQFIANNIALPRHDRLIADQLYDRAALSAPAEAPGLLQQSRLALEAALAKAPGRAANWAFLAWLGEREVVPLPQAAAAFRMAVLTEGFSPSLTTRLFELGIRLWPVLNQQEQAAFRILTLRQWAWQDGLTAEIAVKYRAGMLITDQMADSPEMIAAFLHRYNFIMSLQQPSRR